MPQLWMTLNQFEWGMKRAGAIIDQIDLGWSTEMALHATLWAAESQTCVAGEAVRFAGCPRGGAEARDGPLGGRVFAWKGLTGCCEGCCSPCKEGYKI